MTKAYAKMIALHEALRGLGITRAFLHNTEVGWIRYSNQVLEKNTFSMGPANTPNGDIHVIYRKPR
jgi:hypothetical protein